MALRPAKTVTAPVATIIAAVCALVGGIAGAFVSGFYDQKTKATVEETRVGGALELERLKFQSSLILKAIDTEDQTQAVKTLNFFANAGLIPDYKDNILDLASKDEGAAVPTLRSPPNPYQSVDQFSADSEIVQLSNAIGLLFVSRKGTCTTFLVRNRLAIVPDFCAQGTDVSASSVRLGFDRRDAEVRDIPVIGVEARSTGLTVLRLGGDAGAPLPELDIVTRAPVAGEPVYMIHHPKAGAKQVSSNCFVHAEQPLAAGGLRVIDLDIPALSFTCRSEGGSAGAPVFAQKDNALLGVHVAGQVDGYELSAIPTSEFIKDRPEFGQ